MALLSKSVITMAENIQNSIVNMFNGNPLIATFIVALLPIFELRGAIPFGMSVKVWGGLALNATQAFLISFLATCLVIPIVALFFIPLLNYLKRTKLFKKISEKIFGHFENKATNINKTKSNSRLKKIMCIMGFVAIPLPLTGVYTGTVLAVLIGLNFYETLIACVSGNLIAGIIITLISTVLKENSIYVLYGFIVLLVAIVLVSLVKKLVIKIRTKKLNKQV